MEGTEGTATGAAATTAPDPTSPAATQTATPQEATKVQTPLRAVNHGPLGEDVVYIATAVDAQSGIDEGQPLAGKIVKVVKDDEVNRILICNLHLFAADTSALVFKADVEMGVGEGKFLFN